MTFARTQPELSIFSPTPDAAATFDEHQALKSILLAGSAYLDIEAVAKISSRSQCFSVFTASLARAIRWRLQWDFSAASMGWSASAPR